MKNLGVLTTMITETVNKSKTVKSSIGEVELEVPQDRKSTFAPQVVKIFPTSSIKSYQCMQRE